jgi:hypothetical protein
MLNRLASNGRITSESVYNMKEVSNKRHGGTLDITKKKCLEGAIFMSYLDAIKIQREVSTPNKIRVASSRMVSDVAVESELLFESNWVRSLLWVHNPDEYRAQMNSIPNLNSSAHPERRTLIIDSSGACRLFVPTNQKSGRSYPKMLLRIHSGPVSF